MDRLASLYLAYPLKCMWQDGREKAIPILMYHSISELFEKARYPYYETRTSPRVFEEQMKHLFENGYSAISLNELSTAVEDHKRVDRSVVITFDDGYRDFLINALPILEKFGFRATVFLASGLMGSRSSILDGEDILNWEDVGELRKRGVLFGSHTVHHLVLKNLKLIDLEGEIMDSKIEIESHLGESVEVFSYPYAFPEGREDFLGEYFRILDRCGYRFAVTTVIGRVRKGDNSLALKRLPVNEYDDPDLFKAKLEGAYDWVHLPQYVRKKYFGWIV